MSDIQALTIPNWGMSMEEGTIVQWLIKVGESFQSGDSLVEIETSKTVNELEAPFAGTLRHIVADTGETLPVGTLIGLVADTEISSEELEAFNRRLIVTLRKRQ